MQTKPAALKKSSPSFLYETTSSPRVTTPKYGPDDPLYYPSSDGEPLAENTLHYEWIVSLYHACKLLLNQEDIFIASDLLWYPTKGDRKTRRAPDVMIAFGRPQRMGEQVLSYRQWDEDNVAPQVVFEVLSQSDRAEIVEKKFQFYQKFGVQEYYVCSPLKKDTRIWTREQGILVEVDKGESWQSPRTGLRFQKGGDFNICLPDGSPILLPTEQAKSLKQESEAAEAKLKEETAKRKLETAKRKAETAKRKAETAKWQAETAKRKEEETRRQEVTAKPAAMTAIVRKMGIDPEAD